MQCRRILGGRKLLVYDRTVVTAIFDHFRLSFRVSTWRFLEQNIRAPKVWSEYMVKMQQSSWKLNIRIRHKSSKNIFVVFRRDWVSPLKCFFFLAFPSKIPSSSNLESLYVDKAASITCYGSVSSSRAPALTAVISNCSLAKKQRIFVLKHVNYTTKGSLRKD